PNDTDGPPSKLTLVRGTKESDHNVIGVETLGPVIFTRTVAPDTPDTVGRKPPSLCCGGIWTGETAAGTSCPDGEASWSNCNCKWPTLAGLIDSISRLSIASTPSRRVVTSA